MAAGSLTQLHQPAVHASPQAAEQASPGQGPAQQTEMSPAELAAAVRYNKGRGYNVNQIREFQQVLGVPTDGSMGPITTRAVYAFQLSRPELTADGKLGTNTRRAIHDTQGMTIPRPRPRPDNLTEEHTNAPQTSPRPRPRPETRYSADQIEAALRYNSTREFSAQVVREIQTRLEIPTTGQLDQHTVEAVFDFQQTNGLSPDGKLGPRTLERMKISVFEDDDVQAQRHANDNEDAGPARGPITQSFSWEEFNCNDGTDVPVEYRANVRRVAENLEVLKRACGGAAITINSGWRSPSWNRSQGGASKSQHLYGKAADLVVAGYSTRQVRAKILELIEAGQMAQGGVGHYPGRFVHYDIRGYAARWNG